MVSSPSTRRAWIEIGTVTNEGGLGEVALHPEGVDRNTLTLDPERIDRVALHPEGVDRNCYFKLRVNFEFSRPPPGGRG